MLLVRRHRHADQLGGLIDLLDDLVQTERAKTEQRSSDTGQEIFTWPYGKTFANLEDCAPALDQVPMCPGCDDAELLEIAASASTLHDGLDKKVQDR